MEHINEILARLEKRLLWKLMHPGEKGGTRATNAAPDCPSCRPVIRPQTSTLVGAIEKGGTGTGVTPSDRLSDPGSCQQSPWATREKGQFSWERKPADSLRQAENRTRAQVAPNSSFSSRARISLMYSGLSMAFFCPKHDLKVT